MSDTTKTEVRVMEGWVSKDAFADPCYAGCSFGKQMRPLLADQKATLVIGDKAVPMSTVMEMLNDIISTTQLATHGQFGLNITKGIAAKYGIKLP